MRVSLYDLITSQRLYLLTPSYRGSIYQYMNLGGHKQSIAALTPTLPEAQFYTWTFSDISPEGPVGLNKFALVSLLPIKRTLINTKSHWYLLFSEHQLYCRHIKNIISRLTVALEHNMYHFTDEKAESQRVWMICPLTHLSTTRAEL